MFVIGSIAVVKCWYKFECTVSAVGECAVSAAGTVRRERNYK